MTLGSSQQELSPSSIAAYLGARQVVPQGAKLTIEELGGGISNRVIKVSWSQGCLVVKQALPKLRVVADWSFDPSRIFVERMCMQYLNGILPKRCVPQVVFQDDQCYLFGMSCAPRHGTVWKELLLNGIVQGPVAIRVGMLLAAIHSTAATDVAVRRQFLDQTVLIQGRVDPYHSTVASVHQDLARVINDEIERLLDTRVTLVLGDYSPKNIIAYRDNVLILDFEVAHWGDPAFDVAFCLCHLILKAVHYKARANDFLRAALDFWHAYQQHVCSLEPATRMDRNVVCELAIFLLARIDGKSPIEYIQAEEPKQQVRQLGRYLLANPALSVPECIGTIQRQISGQGGV